MAWGFGNGQPYDRRYARPRTSAGTLINFGILIVMLIGGGWGFMSYLSELDKKIIVLQYQMADVQRSAEKGNARLDEMGHRLDLIKGPR